MPPIVALPILQPMKSFPAPLFLCLLLSAFLAGCHGASTVTVGLKPELTSITRQSNGQTLVAWRMMNPNIVPYLLGRTNHRIYLNGVLVGTIEDREPLAVPAQTNQERTDTLVIAGPPGEQALAKAAAAGSATYRLETTVIVHLFGEETDKGELLATGNVSVAAR